MGVVQMHQNVKIGWLPSMVLQSSRKRKKEMKNEEWVC